MKMFTCKLRDLLGTSRHPKSLSPFDVLFEHQRHFLEKNFYHEGIKGRSAEVIRSENRDEVLFRCTVSLRNSPYGAISRVVAADWGDFEVKRIRIHNADDAGKDYEWLTAVFVVGLR